MNASPGRDGAPLAQQSALPEQSTRTEQPPPAALNPFLTAPFLGSAAHWNSWRLALTFPILCGLFIVTAASEGNLGNVRDFQLLADLRRIIGLSELPATPSFPLIRDVSSWFFALVAAATCVLTHRQWQHMKKCLQSIVVNGAVKPFRVPEYRRIHRIMMLPRILGSKEEYKYFDALIDSANNGMKRVGAFTALPGFVAVSLTVVAIVGISKNGLFGLLVPAEQSSIRADAWMHGAYDSWWASTSNPLGLIAYGTMACFGIFVILVQNIVGFFCVYIIICMPAVLRFDADWLNRDGCYGWRDFALTYRTAVWSVAMHGLALSAVLVILGIQNLPSVLALVALWIVVVPLYVLLPFLVFKKVAASAKENRINVINQALSEEGIDESDVNKWLPFRDEIDRINSARINPLRIRLVEIPPFFVLVALPVLLTAVQVLIALSLR